MMTSSQQRPLGGKQQQQVSGGDRKFNGNDIGSVRFQSDRREFAGLLMLLAFCGIMQPLYRVAISIGTDHTTTSTHNPFAILFGSLVLITASILSLMCGYHALVHGTGHRMLTASLILFLQCS
jgi:hypothetical protein